MATKTNRGLVPLTEILGPDRGEHLVRAYSAFLRCLDAGLHPTLTSAITIPGNWRDGEFDVLIQRNPLYGTTHEEIAAALQIAEDLGGRLWHHSVSGELAILFVPSKLPGPDGEASPAETRERRARPPKRAQTTRRKTTRRSKEA